MKLIVNADDLGLAESVNRGILETMVNGVVTSASLMVNMNAHDDAMRRLAAARAGRAGLQVGVGLHFNIVAGSPVSSTPPLRSLVSQRTGQFLPLSVLAMRAFTGRIDPVEVERELVAQLRRAQALLAPLRMSVTHIDSHRHAHCFPGVFDVVLRVAREHGIGHVRHPNESPRTLMGRPLALIVAQLVRLALSRATPLNDVGFAGLALMGSRSLERDLANVLARLPAGTTELMVHPGYDSPELAALDPYRAPREREVRALTSPALRDHLRALGMELTHFGSIAAAA